MTRLYLIDLNTMVIYIRRLLCSSFSFPPLPYSLFRYFRIPVIPNLRNGLRAYVVVFATLFQGTRVEVPEYLRLEALLSCKNVSLVTTDHAPWYRIEFDWLKLDWVEKTFGLTKIGIFLIGHFCLSITDSSKSRTDNFLTVLGKLVNPRYYMLCKFHWNH